MFLVTCPALLSFRTNWIYTFTAYVKLDENGFISLFHWTFFLIIVSNIQLVINIRIED